MKMAFVDGTDQVIVVHTGGEIRAFQGICTHEYFELDKGFLTGNGSPRRERPAGRHPDLRAPPVAVRPRRRRGARPARRDPARDVPGRDRGRPDPDRGPRRPAPGQRVAGGPRGPRLRRRQRQGLRGARLDVARRRTAAGSSGRRPTAGSGRRNAGSPGLPLWPVVMMIRAPSRSFMSIVRRYDGPLVTPKTSTLPSGTYPGSNPDPGTRAGRGSSCSGSRRRRRRPRRDDELKYHSSGGIPDVPSVDSLNWHLVQPAPRPGRPARRTTLRRSAAVASMDAGQDVRWLASRRSVAAWRSPTTGSSGSPRTLDQRLPRDRRARRTRARAARARRRRWRACSASSTVMYAAQPAESTLALLVPPRDAGPGAPAIRRRRRRHEPDEERNDPVGTAEVGVHLDRAHVLGRTLPSPSSPSRSDDPRRAVAGVVLVAQPVRVARRRPGRCWR